MAGPFDRDLPRVTGQTGGASTAVNPYGMVCCPDVTESEKAWTSRSGSIDKTSPEAFSDAMSPSVRLATKPWMPGNSRRSRSSAETLGSKFVARDFADKWLLCFVMTMTACVGAGEENAQTDASVIISAKTAIRFMG